MDNLIVPTGNFVANHTNFIKDSVYEISNIDLSTIPKSLYTRYDANMYPIIETNDINQTVSFI